MVGRHTMLNVNQIFCNGLSDCGVARSSFD